MAQGRGIQSSGNVSAADIQGVLRGVRYPADKQRLLFMAEQNEASEEIMDMLNDLPDQEFGGPAEVQQAVFNDSGSYQQQDRGQQSRRRQGNRDDDGGQSGSYQRNGQTFGGDDPNPGQVSSRMRGQQQNDPSFRQAQQRYEQEGPRTSRRDDDEPDHRLRGNETDAIADARHMRHGYDGRGRVRDEQNDHRLSGNETQSLYDARHMTRGYDGRGRVRKRGVGQVEQVDDNRQFQGNQNAQGRRKPLYQMSDEEQEQHFREMEQGGGRQQNRQSGNQGSQNRGQGSQSRQSGRQKMDRHQVAELILNYIEDNGPCDPNDIFDFMQDNGINQNGNAILYDLKNEGKIKLGRGGYSASNSNDGDNEQIPGGQGRVKHPETDGRLRENGGGQQQRGRSQNQGNRGGRQKDPKRIILNFLDEHEEGCTLQDIKQFCEDQGIDGPIGKHLAALRSDDEIERDEEGRYFLANQQ